MSDNAKSWQGFILLIIAILCLVSQAKSQTTTFAKMNGVPGQYEFKLDKNVLSVCHMDTPDHTWYEFVESIDTMWSSILVMTTTKIGDVPFKWVFYWPLKESGEPDKTKFHSAFCYGSGVNPIHYSK